MQRAFLTEGNPPFLASCCSKANSDSLASSVSPAQPRLQKTQKVLRA